MPEPTSTTAVVVATASVTGAAITSAGMIAGIPPLVIVAAVLGAAAASTRGSKIELTAAGLWSALITFAVSLGMGALGGRLCGAAIERLTEKYVGIEVSGLGADALCALLIAMLAHTAILPALSKRLGVEIDTRGVAP